jgi:hypothetical protein
LWLDERPLREKTAPKIKKEFPGGAKDLSFPKS